MLLVSYLRVSTARQGASGLGLEAQRAAVTTHVAAGQHQLLEEFVEVESGAKSARPELQAALANCRLHRATLVIAKLDRLARNVAFIANLMDSGIDFVACDMPQANRLTLHLLAAIAEHEREMISQRTKAALAAAKARGVVLGNPYGASCLKSYSKASAIISGVKRKAKAFERAQSVEPHILTLKRSGISEPREVAVALNRLRIPSPSGHNWSDGQVRRTIRLLEAGHLPDQSDIRDRIFSTKF